MRRFGLSIWVVVVACSDEVGSRSFEVGDTTIETTSPETLDSVGSSDLAADSGDLAADSGDLAADSGDLAADSGDLAADSSDLAADSDAWVPDTSDQDDGADAIDVADAPDTAWRDDLPTGDVTAYFEGHAELVACQPNCIAPIGTSISFSLGLNVPESGPPTLVLRRLDWSSEPTEVAADGTFAVGLQVVQTAAENAILALGRIGPGRVLTVDRFEHLILYTNGFMAGWTSTATTTEPLTVAF